MRGPGPRRPLRPKGKPGCRNPDGSGPRTRVLSPYGPPAAILRAILTGRVTVCFDQRILAEYRDALIRTRLGLDGQRVDAVLENVEANGKSVSAEAGENLKPERGWAVYSGD